jgi:hypothetical protein
MKEAALTKIAFILEEVALQLNDQFNPPVKPDAYDARALPDGLTVATYAHFIWVWAHLHEWREATTPPDEVWDDIAHRMAEEAEMAVGWNPPNPSTSPLSGTLLGTRPREWAQAVRDLPKFRHMATK